MAYIVSYQKQSDPYTVIQLNAPEEATELCTISGVTYVTIPDGVALPQEQPPELTDIATVTVTPELRNAIKAASPHCRLIDARMQEQIRALYSAEDEMYLARIAVGALRGTYTLEAGEQEAIDAYQAHVESVRAWGRVQRAGLGL